MNDITSTFSRRKILANTACGFGGLAAAALAHQYAAGGEAHASGQTAAADFKPPRKTAKRIIFLFMQGGVSQIDSFDYKPALASSDGQTLDFRDARTVAKTGKVASPQRVMQSPWKFAQHGQSGRWVSDLFPQIATQVDDLCMVHSLHTEGVAHGPATLFLHCGSTNFIRPSFGSWLMYGLGSESDELPGFVTIAPSIGNGGARNYGSAFLDARHQGTAVGSAGAKADNLTLPYLGAGGTATPRRQFELLQSLNRRQAASHPADSRFDAAIESYELAWRMQAGAAEHFDLSQESPATLQAYGVGRPETDAFGRRCLLARRLCEAGVRFIQVNYGDNSANPAWDQHSNIGKHAEHALATDQPVAALLADLRERGMLEDTIVWWGSEFGRTPYAQDNGTGRDHNPDGFTMFLCGGPFRRGLSHGSTDELGHRAVEGRLHMHDMHATLLAALGLDHKALTFRHAGRDFRLTDVYGRVAEELFA